jgi:DNA polymerase I-like protein with 3'-5' exonuclease and polymerase domains
MLPSDILAPYACKDGDATFQLYRKFKPLVEKSPEFSKLYSGILIPATYALRKLEKNGGPIDRAQVEFLAEQYQIDVEECLAEINLSEAVQRFERIHGKIFNPNSTMQLRELLFNILNIRPTKKTETGAWSVDKEVLKEIEHPVAEAILDLREKSKMAGTYISNIRNGIDYDDRLRSGFNIHGTTSGRLSSSGTLNYQNIPRDNKDIKKLFKARPGYKIVQCDLGTAEVYYAAVLSDDKFLQQAFVDKLDFHSYVAKQMFNLPCEVSEVKKLFPNERQWAKAITFGIMYQAGPAKIAETVNKDAKEGEGITVAQAKQFIAKYFNEAKALKKFIDGSNRQIEDYAYIYAFFGRKRRLPEAKAPNAGVAKHAIRSGVNFLVQSVASDINVLGLIDLINWVEGSGYDDFIKPFTVVHDSIVSEVREDLVPLYIANAKRCIQADRGLSIPGCPIKVDFEVGPSWGELEDEKDYFSKIQ